MNWKKVSSIPVSYTHLDVYKRQQLESVGDLTVTSFEYPNSVKLDKYPVTYKQVSDFQTWIEEHVTANDDKLYVITGSLYFISQVRKWILEQERAV